MAHDSIIDIIRTKLSGPLPGKSSHMQMVSKNMDAKYSKPSENYKQAAVLLVLFYVDQDLHIIYMKRPSHNKNDKHSGQISFPGGQLEKDDNSLQDCSIRETHEELGLDPTEMEILGQLTSVYVYVSDFMVYPFVAFYPKKPEYKLQKSEVASTIEFPVKRLYSPDAIITKDIKIRNVTLRNVPYFDLDGEVLWGATAMITNEFKTIVESVFI